MSVLEGKIIMLGITGGPLMWQHLMQMFPHSLKKSHKDGLQGVFAREGLEQERDLQSLFCKGSVRSFP